MKCDGVISVDGETVKAKPGTTIAAAMLNAGITVFRRDRLGAPRAPLCGIGQCFECRVEVDGRRDVRACLVPCRDGMVVRRKP